MLPIPAAKKSTPNAAICAHSCGLANSPLETIYIGRNGTYKFVKESIQEVVFGEKVTTIPSNAFSSCVNILLT